ncbi:nucleotidyltransferase family protein [Undibacterium flavidum]|uniref:Nucleotidyltransferase family protein n=1 Tax=Undibacterium flavidum TaxID=2762297 RepID=A0ABR6Y618_9BURK|nr:nucleotidyltransferase family protein [Undibacterium flavidum]MBC3872071.1 nucleotidyltransferase family protein [Undibacterium flavidum]
MKQQFIEDVLTNHNNAKILARWDALALPDSWLVAGCLFQTVWNSTSQQAPESGIKDYDIFYYDPEDLSAEAEQAKQQYADELFADLNITLEVCNQARVHLWYESHFGHSYPKLISAQDGIDRFLIPSTCVGMTPQEVYAPNGFDILYQGVLSMNPLTPHRTLYEQKAHSYQQRWPWLRRME